MARYSLAMDEGERLRLDYDQGAPERLRDLCCRLLSAAGLILVDAALEARRSIPVVKVVAAVG